MKTAQKVRNYLLDDQINRDWLRVLPRILQAMGIKNYDEKFGRFVTIDDRVVFIGGGAAASDGTLPGAKYNLPPHIEVAPVKDMDELVDHGMGHNWEANEESAREISQMTGIKEATVMETIVKWGVTSNDNDADALAIQQEAAKVFGSQLSEWQQEKIASYEQYRGKLEPGIATRSEIRSILNAMYDNTQQRLEEAGVPEYVTLVRGVKPAGLLNFDEGQIGKIYTNTLSSFSSDVDMAGTFAGSYGAVIQIRIPRSRILSTANTGFGCIDESEFVIIGKNGVVGVEELRFEDQH